MNRCHDQLKFSTGRESFLRIPFQFTQAFTSLANFNRFG